MLLASKLFNLLAQPLNWVLVLLVLSLLQSKCNPRKARIFSAAALVLLALVGVKTLPDLLVAQLENQYPEIASDADLRGYAGVVILGGALEPGRLSQYHQQPLLNASGERMTMAVALWHHNPALRLLFAGGEGELFGSGPSEAVRAQRFFDSLGVPRQAVTLENHSQNSYENAVYSAQLAGVDPRQPWLLLTSAWHMPRSLATFKKAGWNVTPYPVDFRTGGITPLTTYNLGEGAVQWELLLHEYLGIAAYRLSGRI